LPHHLLQSYFSNPFQCKTPSFLTFHDVPATLLINSERQIPGTTISPET
jgi:hypothetical protein